MNTHKLIFNMKRAVKKDDGFGLVDAVVALAILIIGLLSTAFVMSAVASHQIGNSTRTVSTHLAQEKVEELRDKHYLEVSGNTDEFGDMAEYLDYRRVVTVLQNQDNTLKTVDVTVSHINGDSLTLSTRFAR